MPTWHHSNLLLRRALSKATAGAACVRALELALWHSLQLLLWYLSDLLLLWLLRHHLLLWLLLRDSALAHVLLLLRHLTSASPHHHLGLLGLRVCDLLLSHSCCVGGWHWHWLLLRLGRSGHRHRLLHLLRHRLLHLLLLLLLHPGHVLSVRIIGTLHRLLL